MNGAKMTKNFFFQMIEKRLSELTEQVEELKADKELSFDQKLAKENILFGRIIELRTINTAAMDVDFMKYAELDQKIREAMDKI